MYRELLLRIKVNRHFPSVIISAHPIVRGICLGSIEYEQIVEAINLFVSLYHLATPSALLLCESLELMQIKVGIDILVLKADYKSFGYLASRCWIQSLWEATSDFGITIYVLDHAY